MPKGQSRRKTFRNYDGFLIRENVCSDYTCRFCGSKASYCNYVGDLCLQAFVPHQGACGAYVNNEKNVGYVSDCTTCRFNRADGSCELMETENPAGQETHE